MDRRQFLIDAGLKLTGLMAAASAVGALTAAPAAAAPLQSSTAAPAAPAVSLVTPPQLTVTRLAMPHAGEYRVSGIVRLESPMVEISGIANSQQISWSGVGTREVAITSYEIYDGSGPTPELTVRGGRLASLSVTPIELV